DTEIEWIQLGVRREGDVDAIETKPRFVDDRGTERVCLIEREDLPARLPRVAETRDRVSLERRLAALIALQCVVSMQAIVNADVVLYVEGALIDIHRRGCCTTESVRAHVRNRNQGQELLDDRIGNRRALRKG